MSVSPSPVQLGGAVVLGSAAVRTGARAVAQGAGQLPATGAAVLGQLSLLGGSLVAAGALMVRRGRRAHRDAGHPFE
ncbi:MAG: LPXTG cell wall anchor domain-containing protein [Actinobacteria bacterium]|nr:LPXTG cell wall anchor domain-containing protein [Actinomycetota bacterium]